MAVKEEVLRATSRGEQDLPLDDLVVSKIVELGCACAPDLAGQLGHGTTAKELVSTLESLVARGVLRHKVDEDDPRKYNEYQTVYELAR